MKKRWWLLLLFAALAVVAWWLWKNNTGNTFSGSLTDFAIADTASVDRIFIAEKTGGTVDLRRVDDGWTVNGLPAKGYQVNLLLKTFKLVELRAPVPKAQEPNVLRVMAGTAKKVEIYQGGKRPTKIWWVGGSTADHYGTYMVLEIPGKGRSDVPFEMGMAAFTGVLNTRFHTVLDDWRSSRVTSYPRLAEVRRVELDIPSEPHESYAITYEGGNKLTLYDGQGHPQPMDTLAVQDVMLAIRGGNYESIVRNMAAAERDSILASQPWFVLTVHAEHGDQRIPFWGKAGDPGQRDLYFEPVVEDVDRMYALVDDSLLVTVQRFWWDRVTRPLSWLKPQEGH